MQKYILHLLLGTPVRERRRPTESQNPLDYDDMREAVLIWQHPCMRALSNQEAPEVSPDGESPGDASPDDEEAQIKIQHK